MKIILTTNIKKLGKIGEVVNVKDGFARNYLLPKKMALRENKKNLEIYNKIQDDLQNKEKLKFEEAKNLIEKINNIEIRFNKEADEKDQLYGSISKKEIISYLLSNDIKVLSDDIKILEPIRSLGEHQIEINPYEGITETIKIFVKKN
ncbi:MAG: 50S ribosomal protein L9 [Rickettsiales bacterium]|nr:50S ribosomal protein L9 [Rickettsiales bacterium]